jgi:STAM-binding protein
MSQHQMKQGYVPSLHSMFQGVPQDNAPISSLLFQDGSGPGSSGIVLGGIGGLYNNPPPQQPIPTSAYEQQTQRRQSPIPPAPPPGSNTIAVDQTRITPASSGDVVARDLKTVYLPRESLPRFLNVAAVNTARNRETCGLLLGKDKKSRFVVTTLLIPKQHSTSDTCTMDEEELVMSFTEERSLITLGWVCISFSRRMWWVISRFFLSQIHTHPTQSCFMSSVDLHTHSGFQRMLPESFAVVCAPTSTPK